MTPRNKKYIILLVYAEYILNSCNDSFRFQPHLANLNSTGFEFRWEYSPPVAYNHRRRLSDNRDVWLHQAGHGKLLPVTICNDAMLCKFYTFAQYHQLHEIIRICTKTTYVSNNANVVLWHYETNLRQKPTKLLPIKSWRLKYFPIFINATGQELFSLPSTRQHIYSRSAEIWIGDGGLVSRSKSNGFVSVAITDKRMLWADGQGMVAWINGAYYIAGWRCHCGYLEELRGWILFS